jgi:small subunit ribosomal protein S1
LDEALEREIQEALGGKSIEELLDENAPMPRRDERQAGPIGPGSIVKARIAGIDRQAVLVEIGPKDQGLVPQDQFEQEPKVGDVLELEVSRYDRDEDMWILSRKGAVEHASWETVGMGQTVEAMVTGMNKGGLEVSFGGINAFMPISQVSVYRVEDASEYIGKKIRCQVVEVDRRDRRVIVSGRALMELENQQKREQLMAELKEGDIREGIVRQVMPYGAFVDLGGVDGLVHVSQIAYTRVEDPAKVLQNGMKVNVKVLKIDKDTGKVSLGMKQVGPDPWTGVENKYPPGTLVNGVITRVADFGGFCQIEPGLEGLIPISELSWTQRVKHPSEMLTAGQEVQAVVLAVDEQRKRVSLSIKQARANPWLGASQKFPANKELAGTVSRIADFGAFVTLEPGVEGLVHISEISDQRVRKVEDVLKLGQQVNVKVLEVDEQGRRVSLTMKGVVQADQELPPLQIGSSPAQAKKRKAPLKGGLD